MAAKKGAKKAKRGAKKARSTKKAAKTAKKYKKPAAARRPPVAKKRARRSAGRHAPKDKEHVVSGTFAGKPYKSADPDEEDDEFGPLRADQEK
jgi:hypothetical protein